VIVATCFVGFGNSLLWVRRAIEPRQGLWAIPGGFVEHGEPLREGAARELYEEAGVVIPPDELAFYMMGSLTFINQIYVGFRGTVHSAECNPGRESLEARFFTREECPWDEVAYPEVNESVELAYDELESGQFHQWQVEMTANSYDRQMIHTGPLKT
jgi:ADP-ribose pyrophosphatase YjhB (NUDIX family)